MPLPAQEVKCHLDYRETNAIMKLSLRRENAAQREKESRVEFSKLFKATSSTFFSRVNAIVNFSNPFLKCESVRERVLRVLKSTVHLDKELRGFDLILHTRG